jgi:hypothetical protein
LERNSVFHFATETQETSICGHRNPPIKNKGYRFGERLNSYRPTNPCSGFCFWAGGVFPANIQSCQNTGTMNVNAIFGSRVCHNS